MFALLKRVRGSLLPVMIILCFLSACGTVGGNNAGAQNGSHVINVVAAENFYGDIVKQLGGSHVAVTSILSDPNIDPHAYESSPRNAITFSKADLVVANGGGYDDWVDKLLSASPTDGRKVLKGFDIAPHKLPNNEHVWYGVDNVQAIAATITATLKQLDAADAATFTSNQQVFDKALAQIQQKIDILKAKYAGTPIGLTETIYLYQTEPMGLKVLTPFEFEKAIAEGNDPPVDTVTTASDQISKKQIKVLIYNQQTVTPVTSNLQSAARAKGIPVMAVTETMPPGNTYQSWMLDQLNALQQTLGG